MMKRLFDMIGSLIFLLALSPLMAGVALAVLVFDGRPVLFWQTRIGLNGRAFKLPKFRTMRHHTPVLLRDESMNLRGPGAFKLKHDPRVTVLGRVLRRWSLDELPQLWCVLMGRMSLVGPRPPLPDEVAGYSPRELKRLAVKPGLTCIWQVSGRCEISFSRQVEMDLDYIHSRSLWLDLKLVLQTIPAILNGRGAY